MDAICYELGTNADLAHGRFDAAGVFRSPMNFLPEGAFRDVRFEPDPSSNDSIRAPFEARVIGRGASSMTGSAPADDERGSTYCYELQGIPRGEGGPAA